jgi:hypothetical protein
LRRVGVYVVMDASWGTARSGPQVPHLLAQDDAIFEAVHEVVTNAAPRHPLNPLSQLLLPMVVVLLGQLGGEGHRRVMRTQAVESHFGFLEPTWTSLGSMSFLGPSQLRQFCPSVHCGGAGGGTAEEG